MISKIADGRIWHHNWIQSLYRIWQNIDSHICQMRLLFSVLSNSQSHWHQLRWRSRRRRQRLFDHHQVSRCQSPLLRYADRSCALPCCSPTLSEIWVWCRRCHRTDADRPWFVSRWRCTWSVPSKRCDRQRWNLTFELRFELTVVRTDVNCTMWNVLSVRLLIYLLSCIVHILFITYSHASANYVDYITSRYTYTWCSRVLQFRIVYLCEFGPAFFIPAFLVDPPELLEKLRVTQVHTQVARLVNTNGFNNTF